MSMTPPGPPTGQPEGPPPGRPSGPPPGQAPSAAGPSLSGTTPDPAPGGGRSRRGLVVLLVGLVVFLAAGGGAYALARDYRANQMTQDCGSSHACIPGLKVTTLTEALKDRGHRCVEETSSWHCDMVIGRVYFDLWLQSSGGYVYSISIRLHRMDDKALAGTGLSYLSWFGALPFRDDPVLTKEIKGWIAQQIENDKDTKATIGDYEYVLQRPEAESVEFSIQEK